MVLLTACVAGNDTEGTTKASDNTTGTLITTNAPSTTEKPQTTVNEDTTEAPEDTTVMPDDTTAIIEDQKIEISNTQDLLAFMNAPDLGGDYILTSDIEFNDITSVSTWSNDVAPTNVWTPVGSATAPFYGTFDGQGHSINGLYVKVEKYAGFFGCICNATIENIVIGEGYISATGAVAGGISAYYFGFCDVIGCVNYATITATSYLGGILGKYTESAGNDVKVELCVNRGNIIGTLTTSAGYVGGITGTCIGMSIDKCANFGDVSIGVGVSTKGAIAGGIAGLMGSSQGYSDSITNCYNVGTITATQSEGNAAIGGIVGRMNDSLGTVSNCYNLGKICVGGSSLLMTAYVAAENSTHNDYTNNLYNSGAMVLIGSDTNVTPAFTEHGLKGQVVTGTGAVANMEFDSTIWIDTASGTPILKDINVIYQEQ